MPHYRSCKCFNGSFLGMQGDAMMFLLIAVGATRGIGDDSPSVARGVREMFALIASKKHGHARMEKTNVWNVGHTASKIHGSGEEGHMEDHSRLEGVEFPEEEEALNTLGTPFWVSTVRATCSRQHQLSHFTPH